MGRTPMDTVIQQKRAKEDAWKLLVYQFKPSQEFIDGSVGPESPPIATGCMPTTPKKTISIVLFLVSEP